MIRNGCYPTKLDKRDLSYHRTFGTVAFALNYIDYTYDSGLSMPDQNADGLSMGCTGYAQASISGDEDYLVYDPRFTYEKTCFMEGHDTTEGCDIRTSIKSTRLYGLQLKEKPDDPLNHRRGQFYQVDKLPNYDWFDCFRLCLRQNKRPISCGTQWYGEWETPQQGVLTASFISNPTTPRHNYEICGEKSINNLPYLIIKSWQGKQYGDNGFCYIGREAFNKAFNIWGTVGFTFAHATPEDVKTIKLDYLQWALVYISRILGLMRVKINVLN